MKSIKQQSEDLLQMFPNLNQSALPAFAQQFYGHKLEDIPAYRHIYTPNTKKSQLFSLLKEELLVLINRLTSSEMPFTKLDIYQVKGYNGYCILAQSRHYTVFINQYNNSYVVENHVIRELTCSLPPYASALVYANLVFFNHTQFTSNEWDKLISTIAFEDDSIPLMQPSILSYTDNFNDLMTHVFFLLSNGECGAFIDKLQTYTEFGWGFDEIPKFEQ